jgi:hypothetical protein
MNRKLLFPGLLWVALVILSCFMSSCTVVHGNREKGTYTYATMGGDTKGLAQTSEGVTAESVTTSESFKSASDAIRKVIYAQVAGSVIKAGVAGYREITNAKTAAGTAKVQATEATKQSAIQAQSTTEQARIASETEIATTPQ